MSVRVGDFLGCTEILAEKRHSVKITLSMRFEGVGIYSPIAPAFLEVARRVRNRTQEHFTRLNSSGLVIPRPPPN